MIDEAFISKQCCQKQTNDCKPKCQIKNEIKLLNTSIIAFVSQLCSPFANFFRIVQHLFEDKESMTLIFIPSK